MSRRSVPEPPRHAQTPVGPSTRMLSLVALPVVLALFGLVGFALQIGSPEPAHTAARTGPLTVRPTGDAVTRSLDQSVGAQVRARSGALAQGAADPEALRQGLPGPQVLDVVQRRLVQRAGLLPHRPRRRPAWLGTRARPDARGRGHPAGPGRQHHRLPGVPGPAVRHLPRHGARLRRLPRSVHGLPAAPELHRLAHHRLGHGQGPDDPDPLLLQPGPDAPGAPAQRAHRPRWSGSATSTTLRTSSTPPRVRAPPPPRSRRRWSVGSSATATRWSSPAT